MIIRKTSKHLYNTTFYLNIQKITYVPAWENSTSSKCKNLPEINFLFCQILKMPTSIRGHSKKNEANMGFTEQGIQYKKDKMIIPRMIRKGCSKITDMVII